MILAGPLLGATVAAPLGALWGWVDQKGAAVHLVRQLSQDGLPAVRGAAGHRRHELLKAAHTIIVGTAFFESLAEAIGSGYRSLAVTEREKIQLITLDYRTSATAVERLYEAPVAMPSAVIGFDEIASTELPRFFAQATETATRFFDGLEAWPQVRQGIPQIDSLRDRVVRESVRRYRSSYLELAAEVPEFLIWAGFQEHAATRGQISILSHSVSAILEQQAEQLVRLEQLLLQTAPRPAPGPHSQVGMLGLVNRSALTNSLVPEGTLHHSTGTTFPTLEEGYVTPRFRHAVFMPNARPAQEAWWGEQSVRSDLDRFLAGHFASPEGTRLPMLVLGHPGAGKSLLTRVLAARLPAEGYVAVRVPLRSVDADAPVWEQIQQALDSATHGRVTWAGVTDESAELIRVVLLDGFDELLLAANHRAKIGYLQEVADFQRREYEMQRPVAVIVTTRTVVADRARLPTGCSMVQLVDFDEPAVVRWLDTWNEVNRSGIFAGHTRAVAADAVLRHAELAHQPLLLLMLALYGSDPQVPDLSDSVLSEADLYRGLLDNFIRREVGKTVQNPAEIETSVRRALRHLGIAAFAMFNRPDGLRVSESELAADFAALLDEEPSPGTPSPAGNAERTIGQFFFVQTSEINTRVGLKPDRCYEFLHATFEEFLIALHVVELLDVLTETWRMSQRAGMELDIGMLRALLSHRCLALRMPILNYARALFAALPGEQQGRCRELLRYLCGHARRWETRGRAVPYRPQADDVVRAAAAYTANLFLLAVYLAPRPLPLADVCTPQADPTDWMRSTVRLWRAGLNAQEWEAVADILAVVGGSHVTTWTSGLPTRNLTSIVDVL
ncbi:hypothetical protein [Plantactinospora sp. B5E13]|uniref:NACHT domain-containing protein n=1 Tax=Plantactinospora sp. B5E13 TaxID=3153758 RepID=UPI00325EBFE1